MPFTYAENGVNEEGGSKKVNIYADNFFQVVYQNHRNSKIDYGALRQTLAEDGAELDSMYFFQHSSSNDRVFTSIKTVLKTSGWEVIEPVPQRFDDEQYAYMCEASAMQAKAFDLFHEEKEDYDIIKNVFCINHIYYYPMLDFFSDIDNVVVKLVSNLQRINELLISSADEKLDMLDLRVDHVD